MKSFMIDLKKLKVILVLIILITMGGFLYFRVVPEFSVNIRDKIDGEKLKNVRILYVGSNSSISSSLKNAGANVDTANNIKNSNLYNIFVIDRGFVDKVSETIVKDIISRGGNIFFNNITNTKEIANKFLKGNSYEVLKNNDGNSIPLLKLYGDNAGNLKLLNTSYLLLKNENDYSDMLMQILNFSTI